MGAFTFAISIPTDRITNMFVSAFESGYSPWIGEVDCPNYPGKESWWYADDEFADSENFHFDITYDGENEAEGTFGQKKTVVRADLVKGLEKMANGTPHHFADIVNDNTDAITADVFMQYVVFGDVIYG